MTLHEYMVANGLKDKDLALELGISRSYVTMLRLGQKTPPDDRALTIFEKTGVRMGRLKEATQDDIQAMRRIVGQGVAA